MSSTINHGLKVGVLYRTSIYPVGMGLSYNVYGWKSVLIVDYLKHGDMFVVLEDNEADKEAKIAIVGEGRSIGWILHTNLVNDHIDFTEVTEEG